MKKVYQENEARIDKLKKRQQGIAFMLFRSDDDLREKIDSMPALWQDGDIDVLRANLAQISLRVNNPDLVLNTGRSFLAYMHELEQMKSFELPSIFDFPKGIKFRQGFYYICGARPKVGKTTTGCCVAYANLNQKIKTHFISLEAPDYDIWMKIYQTHRSSKGDGRTFLEWEDTFRRDKEAKAKFMEFWRQLSVESKMLTVSRMVSATIDDIGAVLNSVEADFVIIDYAQRIAPSTDVRHNSMREAMLYASRKLADYASASKKVVLLFSQLNIAGQFKESGSWEEDSAGNFKLSREMSDDDPPKQLDGITIDLYSSRYTLPYKKTVNFNAAHGVVG